MWKPGGPGVIQCQVLSAALSAARRLTKPGATAIEPNISGLTQRELQVLAFIGRGYSIPQIAEKLFRSQKTIETHRQSLGRKLGVSNRVELARIAIQAGLAPLDPGRQPVTEAENPRSRLSGDGVASDAVYRIESGCSAKVGEQYCSALCENITRVMGVNGSGILTLDDDTTRARSVAMRFRDRWLSPMTIELEITPCAEAMKKGFYATSGQMAERFPVFIEHCPFTIETFMGIRLDSPHSGEPLGCMMIFHDEFTLLGDTAETVLRVLSVRVSAELDRMKLIDSLQRSVETLEQRIGQRNRAAKADPYKDATDD